MGCRILFNVFEKDPPFFKDSVGRSNPKPFIHDYIGRFMFVKIVAKL